MAAKRVRSCLAQDAYLLVQCEPLCSQPAETLGKICRCLNVETVGLIGGAKGRKHHLGGNRMRLRASTGLHVDEAEVRRLWRERQDEWLLNAQMLMHLAEETMLSCLRGRSLHKEGELSLR